MNTEQLWIIEMHDKTVRQTMLDDSFLRKQDRTGAFVCGRGRQRYIIPPLPPRINTPCITIVFTAINK